ncbi:hypothetical protein Adu01nite_28660 [Paractinoplanes durhamensis]|uniref:Proteinase inhibitor I42 chagasin domain-containing protein n=1 Tax=Paractinoplanes durhamensis TaxID=113563 RepID=A0ABQ3YVA9_9ACTN|nr:hypothetical protein Adu01nite_28660 [Actinoplanes durhamensis]
MLVVVVVVLGGLGWGGIALYRHQVYGAVFTESQLSVAVDRGDRFSLAVPDRGGSIGDSWTAQAAGDQVTAQGKRTRAAALVDRVRDPLLGGGGGTTFFSYDAAAAGTTSITLSYCFQGCDNPATKGQARTVTWNVTVR